MYERIVPVLVDTELRRGEAETEFSWDVRGISYIRGISYLVRILMALGKDTLGREAYYSWYYGSNDRSKKAVLSGFLKDSYPAEGERGEGASRESEWVRGEEGSLRRRPYPLPVRPARWSGSTLPL